MDLVQYKYSQIPHKKDVTTGIINWNNEPLNTYYLNSNILPKQANYSPVQLLTTQSSGNLTRTEKLYKALSPFYETGEHTRRIDQHRSINRTKGFNPLQCL